MSQNVPIKADKFIFNKYSVFSFLRKCPENRDVVYYAYLRRTIGMAEWGGTQDHTEESVTHTRTLGRSCGTAGIAFE